MIKLLPLLKEIRIDIPKTMKAVDTEDGNGEIVILEIEWLGVYFYGNVPYGKDRPLKLEFNPEEEAEIMKIVLEGLKKYRIKFTIKKHDKDFWEVLIEEPDIRIEPTDF